MIDVHAHINYSNFPRNNNGPDNENKPTMDMIISHAKKASIQHIVAVSESIHDVHDIFEIASTSDNFIWPARGLHPVQCDDNNVERSVNWDDFKMFEPLLQDAIQHKKICCVGEVGLDFTPRILANSSQGLTEDEIKDMQRAIFKRQVQMAMQANLPVNVHSRSAGHHALDILYECKATKVIMHAFDGRYYFSIAPIVVRSPQKQTLVSKVPLSNLLLESDAPALGPEKGVDNEPANLMMAAREIARIKNISVDQVIQETTRNARQLFSCWEGVVA
ncbi:putative deoxyribonuclease TATDN3-like protein [Lichtheimia hyalospora FSU 10163]|nr:putative deoxyribonuclease TATDN3-like protein [Lichtheimia hyalospora FSU 10163]